MLARLRGLFTNLSAPARLFYQNHNTIANSAQAGLAFTAAFSAFFIGGDMLSVSIALLIGWLFACFAILGQGSFSGRLKVTCCLLILIPFILELFFIYDHHKDDVSNSDILTAVKTLKPVDPGVIVPGSSQESGSCYNLSKKFKRATMTDVQIGTAFYGASWFPFTAIMIDSTPFLTVGKDERGLFNVTFNLYDKDGYILAEVVKNHVFVPPIARAYIDYRINDHFLEVKDGRGDIRLFIEYKNDHLIKIKGEFYFLGQKIVADDKNMSVNDNPLLTDVGLCGASVGLFINLPALPPRAPALPDTQERKQPAQ